MSLVDVVEWYAVVANGTDEDVFGVNGVGGLCDYFLVVVGQGDGYVDGTFWEGDVVGTLEGFFHSFGFVVLEPFLEECAEGVDVDDLLAVVVSDGELSVAVEGFFCQSGFASGPAWLFVELFDIDVLPLCVSCKNVVDAQGVVFEILVELLCPHQCCCEYECE